MFSEKIKINELRLMSRQKIKKYKVLIYAI